MLQADADWDELQTDPASAPQEPQSPPAEPEPVAPAPAAPQAAPPPEIQPEPRIPLGEYHIKDIRDINPRDILPPTGSVLPKVETVPSGGVAQREREIELFHWQATGLRYYPLYFEDMPLERYGHSLGCLQPLWSTGQFYAQVLLWPYEMGLDPPCKPLYALGYERPGDCVPRLWYQPPVNPAAAVSEAAAWSLFMVIFP